MTEQNGNGHFFREVKVSVLSALVISMIFGIWNMWTSIGKNELDQVRTELEQLRTEFENKIAMQQQVCEKDSRLHETQTKNQFERLENQSTDANQKISENKNDIREIIKDIQKLNLAMQRFSFALEQKYKPQKNDAPEQPFYLFPKVLPSNSKTPCPITANNDDDCDKTPATIEVDSGDVKKKLLEHQNHVIIETQ